MHFGKEVWQSGKLAAKPLYFSTVPTGRTALYSTAESWLSRVSLGPATLTLGVDAKEVVHTEFIAETGVHHNAKSTLEVRMNNPHRNARTTVHSRAPMVKRVSRNDKRIREVPEH